MASGKRQPSKKKRSSQNRQQRAALQARKQAAQAPQVEAQAQAKRSRWRSAPATSTASAPTLRAAATPVPAEVVEAVAAPEATPSAPKSSLPERSSEPKTSLLGRLRDTSAVDLPASATGAKPQPAARPSNGRPSTVGEAARAGKDRAVTRQATRAQPTSRTTAPKAAAPSRSRAAGGGRGDRRALAAERNASQPVGYRAALAGVLAAVAALLLCVLETTPVDHAGKIYTADRIVSEWAGPALESADHLVTATPAVAPTPKAVAAGVKDWSPGRTRERLIQALWPLSAGVVFPPLGALLTFQAVRRRRGAKVVTRASYATLLGVLLSTGLAFYFLPAIIAVIVASYQVRRAEMAAIAAEAAEHDGDVIDAEVVDG